jgi:hypothetical protein
MMQYGESKYAVGQQKAPAIDVNSNNELNAEVSRIWMTSTFSSLDSGELI